MTGSDRKTVRNRTKSTKEVGEDATVRTSKRSATLRKDRKEDHDFVRIFNVKLSILLGFGVLSLLIVFYLVRHVVVEPSEDAQMPRVVTPLAAPKVTDLPMFHGEHKESLYWGTYRPTVYFGVRARTPESLVAGLMWLGVKDGRYFMRHVCQDTDELSTYGWTHHNGRDYGYQVLVDNGMTLKTSILKSKENGSGYGGDWAFRIDAQMEKSRPNQDEFAFAHLFFYVADEGGNALSLGKAVEDLHGNSVLAFGSQIDVGGWELHLKTVADVEVHYTGFNTVHLHNLSDLVQGILAIQARKLGQLELPDTSDDSPSIFVFQISARIPFHADFAFLSGSGVKGARELERVSTLTGSLLTSQLSKKHKEFEDKFKSCFNPSDKMDSESMRVGMAMIGNLLGGIGYFYGQSKIALPQTSIRTVGDNFILYWPAELYTAVPSRPFFPRGFLWDEGFHQLLIWRWDVRISLDIIGHWLDLMNVDGWIPREQILGAEALSKVPQEFVLQHPTNGNPPTLFLVLQDLICGMSRGKFDAIESQEISAFLERSFVRLEAWFHWFNTTQSGKGKSMYYWHGRDNQSNRELNPKTLSSGLDDYPRASHPSEDERHLDLRCWMLLSANCMHSISKHFLKRSEHGTEYEPTAKLLSDFELLNQMHFDNEYGAYFDYGNHTEKVRLIRQVVDAGSNHPSIELVREVLENPTLRFVPQFGYVSLFPFMMRIIPPSSWILAKQLDLISNRSILWTEYGLRSLAKTSSIYMKRNTEHDPPYWRGPIWMNMNYLILSSLHHYSKENGPYREKAKIIYSELRGNLIRSVVRNYNQTGYLWEQYDQVKGKGKGARLFTGWTSLVLLIMAEAYSEC